MASVFSGPPEPDNSAAQAAAAQAKAQSDKIAQDAKDKEEAEQTAMTNRARGKKALLSGNETGYPTTLGS